MKKKSRIFITVSFAGINPNLTFVAERVISSAGSEHYLDKVGVTGSNPVLPTKDKSSTGFVLFYFTPHCFVTIAKFNLNVCHGLR